VELKVLTKNDLTFESNKWNGCVHYAMNGTPYGYTWMLDAVSKDWIGIVENDYESVMPLFFRKDFWGRKKIYIPAPLQKLGIYSVNVLSAKRVENFLKAIPKEFSSQVIDLFGMGRNYDCKGFTSSKMFSSSLILNKPYEEISGAYAKELKEILGKNGQDFFPSSTIKPEVFADMVRKNGPENLRNDQSFHALQRIVYNFLHRGTGNIFGLNDKEKGLSVAAFVIYSHNIVWIPYIVGVDAHATQIGIPLLLDTLIRTHAERPLTLDFPEVKGSDLSSYFGTQYDEYVRLTT
jgi:hypothetical protein